MFRLVDAAAWCWRRIHVSIPPVPAQALAAWHVSVGLWILVGGMDRFGGPGWAGARRLAPWWIWGCVLLVGGLVVLYAWPWLEQCHPRAALVAILLGATPLLFITLGFFWAIHESPLAATSGVGAYGAIVLGHMHLAKHLIRGGIWDRKGCS